MFKSNEELFGAVQDLVDALKRNGHRREADVLSNGLASLNGLTDGWAFLLDALREVESGGADVLTDSEKDVLCRIHDAVYEAVYRRKRKGWWKVW